MPASDMTTKLVSGAASRKPPFAGWIFPSTRSEAARAPLRTARVNGLRGGR